MKKLNIILVLMAVMSVFSTSEVYCAPSAVAPVREAPKSSAVQSVKAIEVSPLSVVNNPYMYLNKDITFNAEFIAFSSLGLDYKPALREAEKYIGVLIKRDDAPNHIIPLSEMKIFLSRENAEKYIDLEQGDKIKITGKVFSTALGDPWVDIKSMEIICQKNKKTDEKK